jgi:hypothetical protein
MEQHIFVYYKHKPIGGSSEKVIRKIHSWQKYCQLIDFLVSDALWGVQKYIICSTKQMFWLQIDSSDNINWNTFSVAPSIINENADNVLFH